LVEKKPVIAYAFRPWQRKWGAPMVRVLVNEINKNSPGNRLRNLLCRLRRDRRGNVSVMVALMLVPLVGMLSLAGEVSSWHTVNRSLQNASDAAAIAAARNGDTTNDSGGVPRYQREANAVAAQYGLVNGTNNVTVTPTTVTCPSGSGTCFQVTIGKTVPVMLTGILGFAGNTTLNGGAAQTISALSIATASGGTGTSFCLLALGGTVSSGVTANGGPKADMAGCSVGSNGDETCNGHNMGADAGYAYYTDSGCGVTQHSNYGSKFTDSYDASLASNIPPNTCSSYPQEVGGVASHLLSSSYTGGGVQIFCGDVQLYDTSVDKKGKTVYTGSNPSLASGTVLVIENGTLDIPSGASLNGSGVTVIFTGPTVGGLTPSHFPTGGGAMNIVAPATGTWQGIAIYQDPNLPSGAGIDITQAGNSPTWNMTGMVYLPNSNVTISGAVGKNSNGACFGLVVNTITINGTGYIVDHNGCSSAGVHLPGISGTLVALVQ